MQVIMLTEIVTFETKPNASLVDPDSVANKIIRETLSSELAARGAHHAYYGSFIERPEMVIIFVGWDSIDDHKNFMSSS